ncbi:MAG: Stp1/IreP family PP2C-type Ser/Thr phosphatase [Ilumatobacteraceae bacterium]
MSVPDDRRPTLAFAGATHTGMVREANEDNYVAEPMVFAVADGMGGHAAGEVASEIAADRLRARLKDGAASVDLMVAAVVEANAAIFQAAHSDSSQRGMGTTVVALAALVGPAFPTRLVLANVCDSRAYLFRDGILKRISVDHSYVQELVSTGHITEHEARTHPRRNIVTRALGIEPTVKVDTWVLPLVRGDRYLLCSDGLVDEVDDLDISIILEQESDQQAAADRLVAKANDNGGHDNTSVIVIDVLEGDEDPPVDFVPEFRPEVVLVDADPPPHGNPEIIVVPDEVEPPGRLRALLGTRRRRVVAAVEAVVVVAAIATVVALVLGG